MGAKEKYNRFSRIYDFFEGAMEKRVFSKYRTLLMSKLPRGAKILEIGIGTGKNIPYYPPDVEVIGIDFSPGMLEIARKRMNAFRGKRLTFLEMDAQNMSFSDNTFDAVISTFVFCTVPDPIKGLKEAKRVLKIGGKAIFLEHMRSENSFINVFLYLVNVVTKPLLGTSTVRDTKANILRAGFEIEEEIHLASDVVRMFICTKRR
ncbi:class I SAM-dependent methyltransferase [Kosmotoga pacifica]|uniref:Methyltransferase type 11 n=1 Tax=Kosmotoga pacifica TaxID=1330330 RepID=A0A0G2ZFW7_9BACT|nr:class I SAM-dependent methyltransferase [Kosmotoga pacifica]AKI97713.1 methyltransferase type 11 [Kosmotoga pacifica]